MDHRLSELIRLKKSRPEERENLDDLEWMMTKHQIQGAKRANILASILLSDWLARDQIRYEDLAELDEIARNILLNQDTNPVAFRNSALANISRRILDTVKTVVFTAEDHSEALALEQHWDEISLPRLQAIDFRHSGLNRERILVLVGEELTYRFPFVGIRRRIVLPSDEYAIALRQLKKIDREQWEIHAETVETWQLKDEEAEYLSTIMSCRKLICGEAKITNQGLGAMGMIDGLRHLEISWAERKVITDEGLRSLLEKTELICLDLNLNWDAASKSKRTPTDMLHIYEKYMFPGTRSKASGLKINGSAFVKPQARLIELRLKDCDITDVELQQIATNCPNLQELVLNSGRVTSKGFGILKGLQEMTYLNVDGCEGLDDEGIRMISEMGNLERLDIGESIVTNEDLEKLANLRKLKLINLEGCEGMTRAGLNRFKEALPECEIMNEDLINFED